MKNTKDTQLHVLVSTAEKALLNEAAQASHLNLSAWVRSTLLTQAGAIVSKSPVKAPERPIPIGRK